MKENCGRKGAGCRRHQKSNDSSIEGRIESSEQRGRWGGGRTRKRRSGINKESKKKGTERG